MDDDINASDFNISDETDELIAASYFHALNEKRRSLLQPPTISDYAVTENDDVNKSLETTSNTQLSMNFL